MVHEYAISPYLNHRSSLLGCQLLEAAEVCLGDGRVVVGMAASHAGALATPQHWGET